MIRIKELRLFVLITALSIVSCGDFLEEEPRALQTIDGALKDESAARLVMNGMYDAITWGESSSNGFAGHSYEFIFGDICTDDAVKGSNDADQIDIQRLKEFNTNGSNGNIATIWGKYWVAISRANNIILNLPNSALDDNLKNTFEAEARFIRAYSYLHLVNFFGAVPLFTEPVGSEEINNKEFSRASISDIYGLINDDFAFAKDNLNQKGEVAVGIATSGAAAAYLARAMMYQLGTENGQNVSWADVLQLTDDIIAGNYGNYRLARNYAEIWSTEGENNEESIWEIQAIDNGTDWGPEQTGTRWTVFQSPFFMGGWGFNNPTADLANSYETNDPRRHATTIAVGEHAFGVEMIVHERNKTGYYHRKAILNPDLWITNKASEANVRKFRYADILLMNAEAAYHTGDISKAISNVSMIRERASQSTFPQGFDPNDPLGYQSTGFAPLDNSAIPSGGQELLEYIWLERRRELGMETLRFMDLLRTGRYDAAVSTYVNTQDPDDTEYASSVLQNLQNVKIQTSTGNDIVVFPIPLKDLDEWGLQQNKGY